MLAPKTLCVALSWTITGAPIQHQVGEDLRARAILEGEPAPYDGQILTTDLAARIAAKVAMHDRELRLAVSSTVALWSARLEAQERACAVDRHAAAQELAATNEALERAIKAASVPIWRRPEFLLPLGFALGFGAAVAAASLR